MRREFLLCILVFLLVFCGAHDPLAFEGVDYDDISENAQILGAWNVDVVNVSSYPVVGVNNYKNFLVSLYSNYESGLNNSEHWEMGFVTNDGIPLFSEDLDAWGNGQAPDVNTNGFLCADFNNDGLMDFFAPNVNDGGRLYKNQGSSFSDVTSSSPDLDRSYDPDYGTIGAVWGDINGDAFVDLLVLVGDDPHIEDPSSRSTGEKLFLNVSDGGNGRMFEQVYFQTTGGIGTALMADFDRDSDLDIVLVQSFPTEPDRDNSRYFENTGDYSGHPAGWFVNQTSEKLIGIGDAWDYLQCSAVVADYDHDGDLDIVFSNIAKYGWLRNNGSGVFSVGVIVDDQVDQADVGAFDLDLDGRTDFVRGRLDTNKSPGLFLNREVAGSTFGFEEVSQDIDLGYPNGIDTRGTRGMMFADLNQNGFTEVFFARGPGKPMLFMASPDDGYVQNDWLGIRLISPGGLDNYYCLGATVGLAFTDTSVYQSRVVDGGSGRASQGDFDLVFGLGNFGGYGYELQIDLVSGVDIDISGLGVNQYHLIEIGNTVTFVPGSVALQFELNELGLEDWVFQWKTDELSDVSRDRVHIEAITGGGIEYNWHGPSTIIDVYGGKALHKDPSDGKWLHTLVVKNVQCVNNRKIEYHIGSSLGTSSVVSPTLTAQKKFCATIQGLGGQ